MSEVIKVRIGITLQCNINVFSNGEATSLEGRDITVLLVNPRGVRERVNATFSGNVASFIYEGKFQKYTGMYRVEVFENFEGTSQSVFDKDAFELVSRSWMEEDGIGDLVTPQTTISGDIRFSGQDGKSAYELAVELGFKGTLRQWLDSLKATPYELHIDSETGEAYYYND